MCCKKCRKSRIFNKGLFFASAVLPTPCSRLPELDIDLKFKIAGLIKTILMCVKFCDDPISGSDFNFIGGGVP